MQQSPLAFMMNALLVFVSELYQSRPSEGGKTEKGWSTGTQETRTSEDVPLQLHHRNAEA
ncbi:hypothetical protein J558_4162 [Acinetobacter baumannii 1106579]|uniref:hypothetical protein n=1 Tax=Acinetobacter baumannii TaxID=470 RepID=UPI00044C225F|nr:hypothetical protein J558_4162 [Acinetobacter baumannii 1106579]